MKDFIQKYFRVGTLVWMSYPFITYDILDSLKKLMKDEYFSAIEITHIPDHKLREEVKFLLAQSHLYVCYGVQPKLLAEHLNPNDVDDVKREMAESILMEAIDEAEYLGANTVAFMAGKWTYETRNKSYIQLLKTTRNICTYAATKNMTVELEIFDFDMDKSVLIGPAPFAAQFAADVRMTHNNFGLLVDLSHFPTTYETAKFVVQTVRPYITHFHFGNAVIEKGCIAYGDKHPRFGFPNSANDIEELVDYLTVLKQEGFFNVKDPYILSMEVAPYNNEDGDIILANTKRVLNRAWSLVAD